MYILGCVLNLNGNELATSSQFARKVHKSPSSRQCKIHKLNCGIIYMHPQIFLSIYAYSICTTHTNSPISCCCCCYCFRKGKRRVTRMVVVVVLAFAICWLPIHVSKNEHPPQIKSKLRKKIKYHKVQRKISNELINVNFVIFNNTSYMPSD